MNRITQFIKKIFFARERPKPPESSDVARSTFKAKYWNFKALLNINHKTLEIMSDMEHALQGNRSFSMAFIRANCTAMSINLYKIIEKINAISSHRYERLSHIFMEIQNEINAVLEEHKKPTDRRLVFPLETVHRDKADHVGSKMANLGEIMNRVRLPVPDGFVVTAAAYKLFVDYNNLQKKINQQLQSLDYEDMEMLYSTSADIRELIMRAPLPPELERAVLDAYRHLEEKSEKDVRVSLRSSALGEDMHGASFAGQYHSELNVSPESLMDTYKKIVASKYSPQAISYRFNRGFRDEDIMMCVGCMAMVDPAASGVMYSRDPGNIRNGLVLINAVKGLGKSAVDGTASPDYFVISRDPEIHIRIKEVHAKDEDLVSSGTQGVACTEIAVKEGDIPAITDEQALFLAGLALQLEDHYGCPQDIEWAIGKDGVVRILQSRPLKQSEMERKTLDDTDVSKVAQGVIVGGGVTASPGIAYGPAFIVNTTADVLHFPQGAILVTKYASPHWAALLGSAAAVVTDRGGVAGHLATVAREFGIPALFDTREATARIQNGATITIDAGARKVYAGKVESLVREVRVERGTFMKGSPIYTTLTKVLTHITPLNLTDPEGDNFTPEGCQTYHDIVRFCHEKGVNEMFDFGKSDKWAGQEGKRLVVDVPMQWWIIDLGDGFKRPVETDTVTLENIASVPMLALWEGMVAVPWEGPPVIDTKGFLSVIVQSTMNRDLCIASKSCYTNKNCAIISKNFCNLSCRFGYHFSVVQAFLSEQARENYIRFGFKGGAADLERKVRRMTLIEEILTRFDFRVDIREDYMSAHLEGDDRNFLEERLKVLGYLNVHTRQLDMIMGNQARARHYRDKLWADIRSLIPGQSS
jgi:pyruvate,water dikinase